MNTLKTREQEAIKLLDKICVKVDHETFMGMETATWRIPASFDMAQIRGRGFEVFMSTDKVHIVTKVIKE